MGKVWIVQLLCPDRHAIMGTAYERTDESRLEEISDLIRKSVKENGFLWECGICKEVDGPKSIDLHFEEGPTRFETMEEALPHLRKIEEQNILSRMHIDLMRGKNPFSP
jgi:hypothetical protein